MSLLAVRGIAKRFGGVHAVDGVDLAVEEGDLYGLIGPNGSGKTTLVDLITGFQRPDAGSVSFDGADVTRRPPHRLAALGIARTFQRVRLFNGMTVLDNVLAGMHHRAGGDLGRLLGLAGGRAARRNEAEEARDLLARVELAGVEERLASDLAYGQQRRLELARALALHPQLLVLDEPVAGMNPSEVHRLGAVFAGLREAGLTIVLVEHHIRLVSDVCTKVAVLNYGRKIAEGTPAAALADEAVAEAYLGLGGAGA